MSSGPAISPKWWALLLRQGHARSLAVTMPSSASECPTMYLVAAWIEISAPCANGLNYNGEAQVLSMMTKAPTEWASSAIAGTS